MAATSYHATIAVAIRGKSTPRLRFSPTTPAI